MPAGHGMAAIAAASALAAACVLVFVASSGGPAVEFVSKAHLSSNSKAKLTSTGHHHGTSGGWSSPNLRANGKAFSQQAAFKGPVKVMKEAKNAVKIHLAVPYGTDSKQQVLSFWEAPGDGPRPTFVFIHGGGWVNGDYRENQPHGFLNQGISFASIEYRKLNEAPLPGPIMDAARALQFLKHNAAAYNIDPAKIILSGQSAGGASALYLNYADDLANPNSTDPVERESTKPMATVVKSAQTSIDPAQVGKWGMGPLILTHGMLHDSVGQVAASGLSAAQKEIFHEYSAINHIDKDDPPVFDTVNGPSALPCKSRPACSSCIAPPAWLLVLLMPLLIPPHRQRRVHTPPRVWRPPEESSRCCRSRGLLRAPRGSQVHEG